MERDADLLLDISVALAVAFAGGWIATRLKLSSFVGYVVAGMVISPFTPGFVGDVERLRLIADVGVVLLLFSLGVQFSVSELLRAGPRVMAAAAAEIAAVIAVALGFGAAAGWSTGESLYIGGAAAITSSVVMVKLLEERGDLASDHGRLAVSWSIAQDLCGVVLIVALGAVAAGGNEGWAADEVLWAAAKAALFVGGVVVIGLRVVPVVLGRVAEERSRELFFLAIAALAIGTALASDYAGLSIALGAFLAGLVVSESDLSHRVLGELLPTRDVFAVLFFVTAGMLIDPELIAEEWPTLLAVLALAVLVRSAVSWGLVGSFAKPHTALLATAALVPAGEFSFLLASAGLDEDALSEETFSAIIGATALSVIISPGVLEAAYRYVGGTRRTAPAPDAPEETHPRLGRHAVIAGYGETGQVVASLLAPRFEVIVVEEDPRLARLVRERELTVVEGSPTSPAVLQHMRLPDARILIITLPDVFSARLLTERAHEINPHLHVIGPAAAPAEAEKLERSGMSQTIVVEQEVALELARHALQRFGVPSQQTLGIIQRARAELR